MSIEQSIDADFDSPLSSGERKMLYFFQTWYCEIETDFEWKEALLQANTDCLSYRLLSRPKIGDRGRFQVSIDMEDRLLTFDPPIVDAAFDTLSFDEQKAMYEVVIGETLDEFQGYVDTLKIQRERSYNPEIEFKIQRIRKRIRWLKRLLSE